MHLFYKKKKPKYLNLYFGFFFSLPLAVSFAFRFSPCSWRAVALCSQSTTTLCKQACSHCYASSAHLFLFFSSSRSFHSHSASLHAHDALSRYAAKAQLCFASQLARTVMLRLHTAHRDLQIVSYIGLHRSHSGLTVCYDFPVL